MSAMGWGRGIFHGKRRGCLQFEKHHVMMSSKQLTLGSGTWIQGLGKGLE